MISRSFLVPTPKKLIATLLLLILTAFIGNAPGLGFPLRFFAFGFAFFASGFFKPLSLLIDIVLWYLISCALFWLYAKVRS